MFNSTMIGGYSNSPRESLSSISRVQTVVSIGSQSNQSATDNSLSSNISNMHENSAEMTDNYTKLQNELQILQEKLNNVRFMY